MSNPQRRKLALHESLVQVSGRVRGLRRAHIPEGAAEMRALMVAAIIAAALAAGCGGEKVEHRGTTATTGKQLMDLQKAYEAGVISKDEYEQARKRILNP